MTPTRHLANCSIVDQAFEFLSTSRQLLISLFEKFQRLSRTENTQWCTRSASRMWVRVSVRVRRCCRFSGLYAFRSSDSVVVGIRRPRIAVLVSYNATASSTLALLQGRGRLVHQNRSKSTYENDTGGRGQKRSRTPSACSGGTSAGLA